VANSGYGDRTKAGSERIALSESWAEFISDTYGARYYGGNTSKEGVIFRIRLETSPKDASFIPYGIYYDLTDNITTSEPWDQVNGYTITKMYGQLKKDVTNPQAFRDAIEQGQTSSGQTNITNVFVHYNWN
jgi:hypothetical protein